MTAFTGSSTDIATETGLLVRAQGLRAAYATGGTEVTAVDGVDLELRRGEVLGVAGDQLSLHRGAKLPRGWRGKVVSLLPQGAMNAISPTLRIRDFAFHVIRAHEPKVKRDDALDRTRARLTQLDLPARVLDNYPHQLSGGMKQRVVTVLSTLLGPQLLIADEPTSALDVSSQRILIEMLKEMLSQEIIGGVVFVTHDLPVLNTIADRIAIMYAGRIAEVGPTREIVDRPRHPYSAALLSSVLVPEPHIRTRTVPGIPGTPPSLSSPPSGCRFHPRCAKSMDVCRDEDPPEVNGGPAGHLSACWWAKDNPGQALEVG